jgi:hypothetical protein
MFKKEMKIRQLLCTIRDREGKSSREKWIRLKRIWIRLGRIKLRKEKLRE